MAFCPKCGNQVNDGAAFCAVCGASVAPAQNNNQPQQGYAQPNYAQPQPAYNPACIGKEPVKTDRSIIMYILLTIVTCGIYGFFFIYKLAKDVNQICEGDGDHVGGLLAYILLSYITCGFYSYYWLYKIQNRLQLAGARLGVPVSENGTTVLLWLILGSLLCGIGSLYGMHIVYSTANKVGTAYNMRTFGRA